MSQRDKGSGTKEKLTKIMQHQVAYVVMQDQPPIHYLSSRELDEFRVLDPVGGVAGRGALAMVQGLAPIGGRYSMPASGGGLWGIIKLRWASFQAKLPNQQ